MHIGTNHILLQWGFVMFLSLTCIDLSSNPHFQKSDVLHAPRRGPDSKLGSHQNPECQAALTSISVREGHASRMVYE